ncbi:S1 family peptidase [Streptomyces sp. SBT349]|uniref:S1 family peptidase n=1 Tax=Streptomyces sp. SBT349 TaxID=1580539 RepID=UPI00066DCC7B|nr:serine protease [Streptomyces sp. SBT349]
MIVNAGRSLAADSVTPTIIGGGEATEEYPFMTAIDRLRDTGVSSFTCGGTLIDPEWVLTAAHCVSDRDTGAVYDAALFAVRVGSLDRTAGGETAGVEEIVIHPDWFGDVERNVGDLALMRLDTAVGAGTLPVAGAEAEVGSGVRFVGWGYTVNGGPELPTGLRQLESTVVPGEQCVVGGEWDIAEGDICTSPEVESGLCGGDSGSPVLQWVNDRWELVGTVSRGVGSGCADEPDVLVSVPYHEEWIAGVVNS